MVTDYDLSDILQPLTKPCSVKWCGKKWHNSFLEDRTHNALRNNQPMFVLFLGRQRAGKSWSSIITGCECFDSDHFDQYCLIFPERANMLGLRTFYKDYKDSLAICEEIGVEKDDWWSPANMEFRYLVETQGICNNILFLNCTNMDRVPNWMWPSIDYRIMCRRTGKTVRMKIQQKNMIEKWKGLKSEYYWNTITKRYLHYPKDKRTQDILYYYEIASREWKNRQREEMFGLYKKKEEKQKPKFIRPMLDLGSI